MLFHQQQQESAARELNQRLIPDNAPRASLCGARAIAAIAVFVASEDGKEYYRNRYAVRLEQWAEETTAKHAAQNARADVFRDVQDKVTGWKNPEELVGFDELQDLFTLRMFVPKDAFQIAAALAELCGVDDVLVEEALFNALNDVEETVSDNEFVTTRATRLHYLSDEALARLEQTPEVLAEMHRRLAQASQELVDADTEFISIHDAALELGWTEEHLIQQLVKDGLVLDVDGELVVSPHPDIAPVS